MSCIKRGDIKDTHSPSPFCTSLKTSLGLLDYYVTDVYVRRRVRV